jgi:hypothetical protein
LEIAALTAVHLAAMRTDDGHGVRRRLAAFSNSRKIAVIHPANREGPTCRWHRHSCRWSKDFSHLARPSIPCCRRHRTVLGHDERRARASIENPGITLITADVTESDIANSDEKTFRQVLGLPALNAPPAELIPATTDAASSHLREGELWPWIVAILLVLLAFESGLAARRIRQAPTPDAHVN